MKTNHILLILVSLVVIAAVAYMLTSAESPEVYQEKIEAERERQYKFIRFNVESPLTEEQKRDFKELNFYPIDPNYKVKARLIPVENRKVREVPMTDGSVERYIEQIFSFSDHQTNTKYLTSNRCWLKFIQLLAESLDRLDKEYFHFPIQYQRQELRSPKLLQNLPQDRRQDHFLS